jgi:prolyl oligopeptidase
MNSASMPPLRSLLCVLGLMLTGAAWAADEARDAGINSGVGNSGAAQAGPRGAHAPPPLAYPATRRLDLVETRFGVPVADPYRWLEKDARADPDVQAWVAAENAATAGYLATLPGRAALRDRLAALHAHERFGTPRKAGNRYFYTRSSGRRNFASLYVRDGVDGAPRLLLDPNGFAADGTAALAEWQPSRDGRYLLYAVQARGSDWRVLRVADAASAAPLPDRIEWVRYSTLAWNGDGSGFFYSRFAPPQADGHLASLEHQQIWFHALGTPQAADRLIFATPARPGLLNRGEVTHDGRWLVVTSNIGTDPRAEISLIPLARNRTRPIRLVRGPDHEWQFIGSDGDRLFFRTNAGAPLGRLVVLDAGRPRDRPIEIVAQRGQMLVAASMIGRRIVLAYAGNARISALIVDLDGRLRGDVPLPGPGSAAGFAGRGGDPETFFSYSSFTTPPAIYRYNVETGETRLFARAQPGIDPADYVTEQIFYPSRDGTPIPMTIVRRRDVAAAGRPAPTLLYGYGGFAVSQTPSFSPTRIAWIEQGGVLAIAGVRGGGEYGKAWHDAGRRANKQNGFDDFIAAAEYLKAQGYTGPDQLAIEGRSNGGLLVAAAVNQRPDLFAAALPAVGVLDMLRFDRFTAGSFWVDDYGRPDQEPDFHTLRAYSPYHNIRDGTDYPAILVTTGDTDDRVVPGHSFKYAAALQHADLGARPRLIRIASGAGHGAGKPAETLIDEYADMYSFIAHWTGLPIAAKQAADGPDGPARADGERQP